MTNEESLKTLSEAIDAYASAKVAANEQLIRFAIGNLQQFLSTHDITPREEVQGEAEVTEG